MKPASRALSTSPAVSLLVMIWWYPKPLFSSSENKQRSLNSEQNACSHRQGFSNDFNHVVGTSNSSCYHVRPRSQISFTVLMRHAIRSVDAVAECIHMPMSESTIAIHGRRSGLQAESSSPQTAPPASNLFRLFQLQLASRLHSLRFRVRLADDALPHVAHTRQTLNYSATLRWRTNAPTLAS